MQAHWEVLLRARAIETQCYVAAAAQCGAHNPKRSSYGHSLLVDPWGTVLSDLGGEAEFALATADIDLSLQDSIRRKMPIALHRDNARRAVRIESDVRVVDWEEGSEAHGEAS